MSIKSLLQKAAVTAAAFFVPAAASAHEVYVLTSAEIAADMAQPPINLFAVAAAQKETFIVWAMLSLLAVILVFGVSVSYGLRKYATPLLLKIKPYASYVIQFCLGLSLVASAIGSALFGPELPLWQLFGQYAMLVQVVLYVSGSMIILGLYPRVASAVVMLVFACAIVTQGIYMIGYGTYFGEALIILLFGSGYSFRSHAPRFTGKLARFMFELHKRKYFIMRVFFSMSLLFAAFYAKFIHGALALNTVLDYHLTRYFHFEPLFVVLGAFLIEITVGIFYLIGFELRFTSIFFLVFLTMSLLFFGESVWPHIILIGTAISMFMHGYDEYTVERFWYKKGRREPVL